MDAHLEESNLETATESALLFWFMSLLHVVSVSGALAVRASEGSQHHSLCLTVFFSALASEAIAAVLSMQFDSNLWLFSGFTLGLMLICTTCDFSRAGRAYPQN